jgi:hypothetical protein
MTHATSTWTIAAGAPSPTRLERAVIERERDLEDWIEGDPSLLEGGLVILARQLHTVSGPLDLLALDESGTLVVVELKRGEAYREALAQAIDYSAWVASLSYDELREAVDNNRRASNRHGNFEEILAGHIADPADWSLDEAGPRIIVAGTGSDDSLRRSVEFLASRFQVPINGVFFDVFAQGTGRLLVRSGVIEDDVVPRSRGRGGVTTEELLAVADRHGTRDLMTAFVDGWTQMTGRSARAERRYSNWTLASLSNGTRVAARLYPYDDTPDVVGQHRGWVELKAQVLADDTRLTADEVRSRLAAFNDGGELWVPITDAASVDAALAAIRALYPQPQAPAPGSNPAAGPAQQPPLGEGA